MFDTSKFTRQPDFTRRTNQLQFPGVTGPFYRNLDQVSQVISASG
jgi:hypothetical protein